MADNVAVTAGSGTNIAADEVVDGTLGTVKVQFVKLMDGTLDGTTKLKILAGSASVAATDPAIPVQVHPNSAGIITAGTAGTPSSQVLSVQGAASMTPVSNRERVFVASSTQLVRPANTTAYTANDEISATSPASLSATVGDVNDDPVAISEILVSSTDTGFAGKNIRVWVYNGATTAGTDNGAFSTARANFVGTLSGVLRTASDGAMGRLVPDEGSLLYTTPASGAKTLQLRVQTLDSATPSANSTTFDFAVKGIQGRAA